MLPGSAEEVVETSGGRAAMEFHSPSAETDQRLWPGVQRRPGARHGAYEGDLFRFRQLERHHRAGRGRSFELQCEAASRGFRVNAAEPAATVIGNIICTGLFSTWSAAYGLGADQVLDMEFVDHNGDRWRLSDADGPGRNSWLTGTVCKSARRLHACLSSLAARYGGRRGLDRSILRPRGGPSVCPRSGCARIGLAIAVLGPHYMAAFFSDLALSKKVKRLLPEDLGISIGVYVVVDKCGRESVRRMAGDAVIDQDLFRTMVLGLPRLAESEALDLLRAGEGCRAPFEILTAPGTRELLEAVLDPSPETLASAVDADLRGCYADIYRQPRFTDMVWINAFRIVSARMGRHKHIIAFILFIPLEEKLVTSLCDRFATVAEEIGIDHDYGFLTPIDMGKRAVLEYDYYIDHTDTAEKGKTGRAMGYSCPGSMACASGPAANMTWMKTVFTQGSARKRGVVLPGPGGAAIKAHRRAQRRKGTERRYTVRITTEDLERNRRGARLADPHHRRDRFPRQSCRGTTARCRIQDHHFARPSPEAEAVERSDCIMDWHGIPDESRRRLRVVPGDLLEPTLGLGADDRCRLLAETDEIIHCASETSFAERRRPGSRRSTCAAWSACSISQPPAAALRSTISAPHSPQGDARACAPKAFRPHASSTTPTKRRSAARSGSCGGDAATRASARSFIGRPSCTDTRSRGGACCLMPFTTRCGLRYSCGTST